MKTDFELEDEQYLSYDDFLDEVYPEIKIGYLVYMPSQVLKAVDPVAYEQGFQDYLDSISEGVAL